MGKAKPASNGNAVVVTTEWRGVFFGYVEDDSDLPAKIVLRDARNCVYWSSTIRGVLGLAAIGPSNDCKIGPKVPTATIWKVTGVFGCDPASIKKWEAAPWR